MFLSKFPDTSDPIMLTYSYDRFAFNPDRYLGDNLSCAESANASNIMDRDHFTFGAGYVAGIVFCPIHAHSVTSLPEGGGSVLVFMSPNTNFSSPSPGFSGASLYTKYPGSRSAWTSTKAKAGKHRYLTMSGLSHGTTMSSPSRSTTTRLP